MRQSPGPTCGSCQPKTPEQQSGLGRSLQDLVGFLSELHALKIDLFLRQQGLNTTTPAGKAMFQMMGVFAEFERAMIQERVRARACEGQERGEASWSTSDSPCAGETNP